MSYPRAFFTQPGLMVLTIFTSLAFLAPLLTPYAPDAIDLVNRRLPPSWQHWFGTDELGRDVLTRTLFGARVSLAIGLCSAALTTLFGVSIGGVSAYLSGWVDQALMRFTDAMLAIPRLPLLMVLAIIFNPGVVTLIVLVGSVGWMEMARVVRAEFLTVKNRPFVDAAHCTGTHGVLIVVRHLIPNILPTVFVAATLAVGRGILLESAMSFFGVGVQPPQASWGNMLYQAQTTMTTEPWIALFPGVFILATVMSVFSFGEFLTARRVIR